MMERLEMLYRSFFVRSIYHVKLAYDGSARWEAKVYLGVDHLWKGLSGEPERGRGRWGIIA
jgi:hypothetical protein